MVFKYFKTFEKTSVAAGAEATDSWDLDEDLIIKRVWIVEKGGSALLNSTFYLKIKDRVYTLAVAPANVLTPSNAVRYTLDIAAAKGEKLAFTFKNGETSAVNVFITFECWSP
jgi:hypothetical protein